MLLFVWLGTCSALRIAVVGAQMPNAKIVSRILGQQHIVVPITPKTTIAALNDEFDVCVVDTTAVSPTGIAILRERAPELRFVSRKRDIDAIVHEFIK